MLEQRTDSEFESQRSGSDQDFECDETRPACGLLTWRPTFLQRFAKAKWFLVFQCWFVLAQGMIVSGLSGVVISSLERRFSLKTNEVGAIVSCYDIAAAIMAVFVSYYGHHHKPKWLGIGAFILGIGCLLFALPHILVGRYEPGSSRTNVCSSDSNATDVVCKSSVWFHILAFVIAEFFIGVGATPVYILGPSYIDENVRHSTSGLFLGIMYAVASLGPAIGFLLGGEFLDIYVDIQQPEGVNLTPDNSDFIGAWWLGYIVGGLLSILVSLPLIAFPQELPGTTEIRAEKRDCSDYLKDDNMPHTLKQLLPMLKSLLTNKPFVFIALAGTFEGFAVGGFSTFLPKFVETQSGTAFGVAVPEVEVVVTLEGKGAEGADGKLQKSLIRTCTDRLVSQDSFKFRRSAFRGAEPKVTLITPPEQGNMPFNLAVNALMPARCSELFKACEMDPVAIELILLVRRWAKDRGISHAAKGHLSPYSWMLLAIYYLQVGTHQLPAMSFVVSKRDRPEPSPEKNNVSAGELLQGFMKFYASFDWAKENISVRQGQRAAPTRPLMLLHEDGKTQPGPCIEDPFETSNNLGSCMHWLSMSRLQEEFARGVQLSGASLAELLEPWTPPDHADAD